MSYGKKYVILQQKEVQAMRHLRGILAGLVLPFMLQASLASGANILDSVKGFFGGTDLPEGKVVQGLKEALEIGTKNAVEKVSKPDGYFRDPNIRIPLPGPVRKVESLLRGMGYGSQVDAFELSMNRAAEKAAPQAKGLFWDAVKKMSFDDARKILQGRENEATLYFKDKTWDPLDRAFRPIVREAMSTVGVTRSYQDLEAKVKTIPFADRLNLNLDEYVTHKAMDGLFIMVGEEERRIRQDPAARVTGLLKEVFGSQGR
jgi:hypothetical protein